MTRYSVRVKPAAAAVLALVALAVSVAVLSLFDNPETIVAAAIIAAAIVWAAARVSKPPE